MRQATLASLYLYYSFWSRGISLCLLDHLGNLFGYEQKGHFEHPLLWVHSILGYTLDSDWFLFPFQSLSFMGDQDVALCLLLFLSAKKHKVNKEWFFLLRVCVYFAGLQRKETTVFLNLFNIYSWYPYPQHLHCQSVLCKSAFFCWSGIPTELMWWGV